MTENISIPLVKAQTTAVSSNVEVILTQLRDKVVFIPDYQRDANQWDDAKKSLFIESLINNLTIPAFFFCQTEDYTYEVVDGQQRLTTILQFAEDKFSISSDEDIDYLLPVATQYVGKKYSELEKKIQKIFKQYPLTIIYLPMGMELGIKLEIFRRINEGGTALTGQDIRLAYYSESKSVTFIRLVGVRENPRPVSENNEGSENDSESATNSSTERMIEAAKKKGLSNPWNNDSIAIAKELWYDWWEGKEKAKGQTPSLMFLWYLVCLDRQKLDSMLSIPHGITHLKIPFGGAIEEALDIYCAQLKDQESGGAILVSSFDDIQKSFKEFAKWFNYILSKGLAGISVDKYKQLALFIAGAVELELSPQNLSDKQWNKIGNFIRKPLETGTRILGDDIYHAPKGRWSGPKGQKSQLDKAVKILRIIKNS